MDRQMLLVIAIALAVVLVAQIFLHRWIRRTPALKGMAAPLAVLICLQGAYAGLRILWSDTTASASFAAVRAAYGLAVVLLLCWTLARVGRALEAFLARRASSTGTTWDRLMWSLAGRAIRRTLPLLALILGAPALALSPELQGLIGNGTSLLLIAVVASILMQLVEAAASAVLLQHRVDVRDNAQARAVHTQVIVLKKVALAVIAVFALASMLMVVDSVRQFGASILASAGIAGIIVGLAAQRSIATLLAGFQIALTQPIRVDDVVVVQGEWGRIEDITLTYVVVRIWDLRRLVLPISHFIEHPFENWTRSSADLLAAVVLHVDYRAPLGTLREELTRILGESRFWDGKVNTLQVTGTTERALVVRALASAADAGLAWDLRCEIRERLVMFLQQRHPECLPRVRASIEVVA